MSQESLFSHGGAGGEFRHELGRRRAEAVVDASSVLYLLCSCSDQRGRKKEEYLVYMDMVVPDGSLSTVSRRRQPGERNCTEFCSVFLFDFFPGVQMGGPRFVAGAGAAFGPSAPSVGPDSHH